MKRILAVIAFSAIIGVTALPAADAAPTRATTYRYTANGTLMPGGAVVSLTEYLSGTNFTGVRHVPRSNRMSLTVDDLGALDGQFVTVEIYHRSVQIFRDCIQVRRAHRFAVTPGRAVWIDVQPPTSCIPGPCSAPSVDVRVRIGDNPVGAEPEQRVGSTVPLCIGVPHWTVGTAGTMTISG